MKKKFISILLVISVFFVSVPAAFAAENKAVPEQKPLYASQLNNALSLPITGFVDEGDGDNGNNGGITLFGNERYKYRTETRFGSWTTLKTFTITKSQAKSEAAYKNAILAAVSTAIGATGIGAAIGSSLIAFIVSTYYNDPDDAVGKYTVKRRSVTKMRINVLTGKGGPLKTGYEFKTTHNGKSTSKIFWLK